jgi:hypothetical protein
MTGPTTAGALLALWAARDERYAVRPYSLTAREEAAVRAARLTEVEDLPAPERREAWTAMAAWQPPLRPRS